IGIGDASDFGQIRAILQRMAGTGMFGSLGANFTGTNYTPEMREAMESTFRMVLDDVRTAFRLHREMGEALIALLMEKEELLAEEVEAFFDRFGLFTPRVALQPPDETQVIGAGKTEVAS
ncbi:MAG: hypothetical protein K8I60_14515, partial [Anaerolineae bacterium]|nr:hypothetical protein [Anaerolineae bacterium]